MTIGKYRLYYDDYVTHLCEVLWKAPKFSNANLLAASLKWLVYGIVVGAATVALVPFLVMYGLRITDAEAESEAQWRPEE